MTKIIHSAYTPPAPSWLPKWREDRPPDQVIVASNGSSAIVLDYIGPAVSWWVGEALPLDLCDIEPGVHLLELTFTHHRDYYGEHDTDIEVTASRPLTDQEMDGFSTETPWDPRRWIENWDDRHRMELEL